MKRIAMTGAAGRVGTLLRPLLRAHFGHVSLIDLQEPTGLGDNETFVRADLTKLDETKAALKDIDGVVHLAGIASGTDMNAILHANVLGTYNLYEAARINKVERVVYASSNHATGFYPRGEIISPLDPMRPDSPYGLSKCWGELVAGLYYDTSGIRSLSIRIGNAGTYPNSERSIAIWISARDLAQLVRIGLTHPLIAATVVYGVSDTDEKWWDNDLARRLGYQPEDRPRDHARIEQGAEGPVALAFQGGGFCEINHDGTIRMRNAEGLAKSLEAAE
ncbi:MULTISPECIES: NAD-dependent epimerase/dehydratase family protein [Rhizobium]|uniref:NAD-dependent epimerase/dehydratase family protein n=1 Tax=Rhizobium TaxID=379 RepID=UPI000BE88AB0|nr:MULTISPECIES: NAD(P)-dependent oxidoreductase [Rhizobium]MBY4590176.1 NAD(P)-dependent oxidoreductase [Rhizobium redzepovicii]MBY4612904.1 NAD(P)-dependent oxidoreductase [Rhizobium redzepovicii]MDR9780531.1 NAD(P)-dependent oxidoreductase [Rhizobium redzepovicii]PDS83348.1 dehydrogenase [Rhizobium sp. L18]TBY51228.1 NAD(P)-dependent oxidoreductase [Rhizobium leguminosarum bv. viciae]